MSAGRLVPAIVDTLDGRRVYADLALVRTVRLNCGCDRMECDRPGGGAVHVLRGVHCTPVQTRLLAAAVRQDRSAVVA